MKRSSGFTLLELLMVVIIIAILASIALPQFLRVAERARASEALAILGAMRSSEIRYKAQSPGQIFTAVVNELDVDVPGFGVPPIPPSVLWNPYAVDLLANDVLATRVAPAPPGFVGAKITVDLITGKVCATPLAAANAYGLPLGPC